MPQPGLGGSDPAQVRNNSEKGATWEGHFTWDSLRLQWLSGVPESSWDLFHSHNPLGYTLGLRVAPVQTTGRAVLVG